MTQENKELLLKDLCARLPYGVIVETPKGKGHVCDINLTIFGHEFGVNVNPTVRDTFSINDVKPYLFPLSSMTEEQYNEFFSYYHNIEMAEVKSSSDYLKAAYIGDDAKYSWLNSHHFDYRGLIERGLAIDATGLNIY